MLWNPVWRIFELLDKPQSGVTVSIADAALGQRDGRADLSRSLPAHVVVIERKVQLLMMRVTEWVDSRGNAWWMVPYLVPLLFSLLAGISVQCDYTYDCSALFSHHSFLCFTQLQRKSHLLYFFCKFGSDVLLSMLNIFHWSFTLKLSSLRLLVGGLQKCTNLQQLNNDTEKFNSFLI